MGNQTVEGSLMAEKTVTIEVTARELTLIRVALLTRLAKLVGTASYDESRRLLDGKTWEAQKAMTDAN